MLVGSQKRNGWMQCVREASAVRPHRLGRTARKVQVDSQRMRVQDGLSTDAALQSICIANGVTNLVQHKWAQIQLATATQVRTKYRHVMVS